MRRVNISNGVMSIAVDRQTNLGISTLVLSRGDYNHFIEMFQDYNGDVPSWSFTWKCKKGTKELVALIDEKHRVYDVNSLEDIGKKVISTDVLPEGVFLNHVEAIVELLIIMDQFYKCEA